MPFTSEKQRRYLWATQPDLAKRWAHKYPESNKNLPMYAKEDKKAALSTALQHVYNYVNARTYINTSILAEKQGKNAKNAADECVKVKVPHSNRPTYAGEEREKGEIEDTKIEPGQNDVRQPANAINSLLQKISAVLAQPLLQAMENETAAREGRQPVHQPKNHGIKQYPQATPSIPLPMGMQAPAQPAAQPQRAPAQPQKTGTGMNSPSANPINSFGALSSTGNINGNAAFGQKNSPDSLKTGAYKHADDNFNLVYPKNKTNYVMPKHLRDNVLDAQEASQVMQAMRAGAPHGALDKTRLDWNGLQIAGYGSRVHENEKITNLGRWLHNTVGEEFEGTMPDKTQGFGDAFLPYANVVSVPSGMGGTLMHELGHAVDFNAFPSDSTPRHLMAATYRQYGPTLWKEHAAWRKGRKGLLDAFANKKLDPQLTHKILTNAAGGKKLGLGSYWGGAIGGGLGLAGGVGTAIALSELLRRNDMGGVQVPGRVLALPVVLGSMLGIAGGTGLGHALAKQPVKSEKIVHLMARAAAKKQGISYEQAKKNIEGMLGAKKKEAPPKLQKAAQSEFLAKVMSMDFPPHPDPEDLELDDEERTKTAVHSSVNAGNVLGGMEAGHREANKLHQVPMTYGAGLGGAIGLLHEYARNKSPAEKTQPLWRKTLRYAGKGGVGALAGTGVGAIAGNMSSDTLTNRIQNAKNQQYQTAQDSLNNLAKELWRNSPDAEPDLNIAGELARDNTSMISQIYRNLLEKRNGVRAVGAAGQHVKEAARLS